MSNKLEQQNLSPVMMSRRSFLESGVAAAMAVYLPNRAFAVAFAPARKLTSGAAQVFVDLDLLDSAQNIHQLFHTAEKHPANPVLLGEKKWERKQGGPCGAFSYEDREKVFKAWYQGVIGTEFGQPGYGQHTLNYAVSKDGIVWERPNVGLYEVTWDGGSTKENNVVVPQTHHEGQDHWESVLKDPNDSDPQRRYKAIGWSSHSTNSDGVWCGGLNECGIYSMTSPDGLRWTHCNNAIFAYRPRPGSEDKGPVGDAQTLMIDALQNRYVAFLRGVHGERLFSTSTDFVNWSPMDVSMPAVQDIRAPYYNHLGFRYGDQYLGLTSHYKVETDGVHHLRVRLLTSADGLRYRMAGPEAFDRPALIDVGDYGEWDRFMCMITGAPPVRVGDKLYIYYRGYSETHDRRPGKPNDSYYAGGNGLATIRLDGFASLASGFDGGTATTKPIVFDGKSLTVNAKANFYGSVVVEILDEQGQPVENYTAKDCIPMSLDSVSGAIAWKERSNLAELAGRPVKLRFQLKNARLYAYRIG